MCTAEFPLSEVDASAVFSRAEVAQMLREPEADTKYLSDNSGPMSFPNSRAPAESPASELWRKRPSSGDVAMSDAEDDAASVNTRATSPPAKKRLLVSTAGNSLAQMQLSQPPQAHNLVPAQLPLPSPGASPTRSQADTPRDANDAAVQGLLSPSSGSLHAALWMLLQRTDRRTLSALQSVIRRSLRRDLVTAMPSEIACKIFAQFDFRTLLRAGEVCRSWAALSQQGSADFWRNLLFRDSLVTSEREYELEREWISKSRPELSPGDLARLLYKRRVMIGRRWRDANFKPKRITLPGQGLNVITCLQFDDDKIAAGSDDSSITIYDTRTGKLRTVLSGHNGGVWAMKYYGNTLASGSTDRTVRIWNIKQGKCTHIFRGHVSTVRCLDIIEPRRIGTDDEGRPIVYPKAPLLVTGSRDATLFVWRLPLADEDEKVPAEPVDLDEHSNKYLVRVLRGHTGSVRAVTGRANILISGSYDTTARVWDLRTGECKFVLAGHADRIYSCVYDFERNQCYTGSVDNTVRIWDLSTGKCNAILEGHQMLVGLIASSRNALVSAAADWTVRIWDPDTGQPRSVLRGHNSAITCVQNSDYVIVSGSQGMLKLWDTQTGAFIRDLLDDVDGAVWQVKFDYRRCIAAAQKDRRTCIEILDFCPPGTDEWIGVPAH
ncbi:DEKNAAC101314 [Brettanomyces naardenensis]|uniref:DEKNAAC101314 n=1 Tax=Brettanomyces naardenensis TaxID=13370 RepID=A0A448YHU7_BRENA|nr:DEKNAAC101314 [Brettanomyces naardenensis]